MAPKHIEYINDVPATILKSIILINLWLFLSNNCSTASLDVIPHPCDTIKCPPLSDIECPEDSDVRELPNSLTPLHDNISMPFAEDIFNITSIEDELFAQCCLVKKCICKTCHIPDCHNDGEVVYELVPESVDIPGSCCGRYECHPEPNCKEVRDTKGYWLTNCKRCNCYSGEVICHQICDEDGIKKPTAICKADNLNQFYEHGVKWIDGCYVCECINGEVDCLVSACKEPNCPPSRKVTLKGSCCPTCWPEGEPVPNRMGIYDDEEMSGILDEEYNSGTDSHTVHRIYDNYDELSHGGSPFSNNYGDSSSEILPHIEFGNDVINRNNTSLSNNNSISSSASTKISHIFTTSERTSSVVGSDAAASIHIFTNKLIDNKNVTTTTKIPPCMLLNTRNDLSATSQVYPEVEPVHQTHQNEVVYIIIIVILILILLSLFVWIYHLRKKQRSYRPVDICDDNRNKMMIKKTNDYV